MSRRLAGTAPPDASVSRRLVAWLAGFEDGKIIRAAFFGMLAATIAVLVIDYTELSARDAALVLPDAGDPVLPASDPDAAPAGAIAPVVTTDLAKLRAPLAVELGSGGVLALTGTIDRGAADRVAAELSSRGEYVRTVALDSPGGSVEDALAIGRLIRDKGLGTSVAAGALCASSCPLILAGGKTRIASARAAIGVHQIYAMAKKGTAPLGAAAVGAAMSDAQKTTADIDRYLAAMGIAPAAWLHALDTPPDRIYYFSVQDLTALKLVTNVND